MHAKTAGFVPPKLKLIFVGGSMAGNFSSESSEIDLTEMKKNDGKESYKIFVCSIVHTTLLNTKAVTNAVHTRGLLMR